MNKTRLPGRKLLVASLGVAAVSYAAACQKTPEQTGNLMAPEPRASASASPPETSGNLMAPVASEPEPTPSAAPQMVGNLMPPPHAPPAAADAGAKKPKLNAK